VNEDTRPGVPDRPPEDPAPALAWSRRWPKPLAYGAGTLVFCGVAALLLARPEPTRPQLTKADVGQPAKFDVRATAATYVPDPVTTKRLRDEASRAVPLVYGHDPAVLDRQIDVLRVAFASVRDGFERYDRDVQAAASAQEAQRLGGAEKKDGEGAGTSGILPARDRAAPEERRGTNVGASSDGDRESEIVERNARGVKLHIAFDGPTSRAGRALPAAAHRPLVRRLERHLSTAGTDAARMLSLSTSELEALARVRFSKGAEQAVRRLLSVAMGSMVVRDKVKFMLDVSSRVVLASARAGSLVPVEKVLNPSEALDLASARARVTETAASLLAELPAPIREAIANCARRLIAENLVFDAASTARERARARSEVQGQFRHYPRGSAVIRQGDLVTAEHLAVMEAMTPLTEEDGARRYIGSGLFAALLALLAPFATRTRAIRRRPTPRDYVFLASLLLFVLAVLRFSLAVSDVLHERWSGVPLSAFILAVPFATGAILVRVVLSLELAILFATFSSLFIAVMGSAGPHLAVYSFVGSIAGAVAAGRVRQRAQLLRTGLWVAAAQTAAALCLALLGGQGGFPVRADAQVALPEQGLFAVAFLLEVAAAAASGFAAALLALALIAVVEATLGYVTTMKYLELGSLENPLLKELFLRAPGTYHHSVVAGSLAEAAAEAIGANGALARVGAYFHDVGKGKCPHYFAENQRGENPHDRLAPHMSALILRRHVDDGVQILREHRLPQPIIDICAQHLGTTLTEYFFVKASRIADEEGAARPDEADFRYAGPKPQFREAALVFVADSVEAAARAIPDPTQERLDETVRRIIRNKFVDGQLDECDLTLRDLDAIAKAMTRVLVAIHHTRPQYPSQREADATTAAPPAAQGGTAGRSGYEAAADPPLASTRDPDAPIDLSDHRRRFR
jgi:hypothetical protein